MKEDESANSFDVTSAPAEVTNHVWEEIVASECLPRMSFIISLPCIATLNCALLLVVLNAFIFNLGNSWTAFATLWIASSSCYVASHLCLVLLEARFRQIYPELLRLITAPVSGLSVVRMILTVVSFLVIFFLPGAVTGMATWLCSAAFTTGPIPFYDPISDISSIREQSYWDAWWNNIVEFWNTDPWKYFLMSLGTHIVTYIVGLLLFVAFYAKLKKHATNYTSILELKTAEGNIFAASSADIVKALTAAMQKKNNGEDDSGVPLSARLRRTVDEELNLLEESSQPNIVGNSNSSGTKK
jgi:hypothetical protein